MTLTITQRGEFHVLTFYEGDLLVKEVVGRAEDLYYVLNLGVEAIRGTNTSTEFPAISLN